MVFNRNARGKEKPIKAFDPKCGNNKSNIESLQSMVQDGVGAGDKMKQVHQQNIDTDTQPWPRMSNIEVVEVGMLTQHWDALHF